MGVTAASVARAGGISVRLLVDRLPTTYARERIPDEWLSVDDNYYFVATDLTQKTFVCSVLRLDVGLQRYAGRYPIAVSRAVAA